MITEVSSVIASPTHRKSVIFFPIWGEFLKRKKRKKGEKERKKGEKKRKKERKRLITYCHALLESLSAQQEWKANNNHKCSNIKCALNMY